MWTHSPTYSLREVVGAIQEHDRYKFERYVDVDSLIQSFVADASSENALALAVANAASSTIKQQITKAIEDGVGTDSPMGQGVSSLVGGQLDVHLVRQGPNAYFMIPTKTEGGAPFNLRFHMTQVPDGYWRVDRVVNVKDLMAANAAEEAAKKAALAKQIEDKLAQFVVVAKLHTSISPDGWSRKNRFQVRFQNNAALGVSGMTGHIVSAAAGFDQEISGEDLNMGPAQTGNVTWEFRVNQFMAPTERMYAAGDTTGFDVRVDSLEYADGTKVSRADE